MPWSLDAALRRGRPHENKTFWREIKFWVLKGFAIKLYWKVSMQHSARAALMGIKASAAHTVKVYG